MSFVVSQVNIRSSIFFASPQGGNKRTSAACSIFSGVASGHAGHAEHD